MPSFIATSLSYIEKAARSLVVLSLVGAGGTGVELTVVFDLFDRGNVILVIFGLVLLVDALDARF